MTTKSSHPEAPPERLVLTADMRIEAQSVEAATGDTPPRLPRFNMVAYSGGAMRLAGWKYPVVVDLAGMNVPSQTRPIRVGHNSDQRVGHTNAIRVAEGQLVAEGVVSCTGVTAREVVADAQNGFPWQASIGASVDQSEFVRESQTVTVNGRSFTGPVNVVRRSTLGEISFVDLGADTNTSANVAASAKETPGMTINNSNVNGSAATVEATGTDAGPSTPVLGGVAPGTTADPVQQMRIRAAAEQERIITIQQVCGERHGKIAATAIREGWDATRTELEVMRQDRPKAPAIHAGGGGDDSIPAEVIEAALCGTLNTPGREKRFSEQTLEAADKKYRRLGIQELILMAAQAGGYVGRSTITRETLPEIFRAAFAPINAAFSTLSLPAILSNVANKELLAGFMEEDQTWRDVSVTRSVSDFKTVTSYRLLDDMEYEELAPGGEIKHGKLSEETYTRQARTYAKMFSLTRDKIIDDDLGAFEDLRVRLGAGAARRFNRVFWSRFMDNASFFTSGRGNYITGADSALDLSGTGLQKGILAFRKLKSPDGKRLGGIPTILLVPPELQFIAQRLFQSTTVNTGGASANDSVPSDNIHAGKYRPVVCDWLSDTAFTGNSAKAWYLLRPPTILAPVVVSFLDGVQTPTVDMAEADFNTLGIQFRGYHDFGVDPAEWLSGIKSKGEA